MKSLMKIGLCICSLTLAFNTIAIGLGDLVKVVDGGDKPQTNSYSAQEKIMKKYVNASVSIMTAQGVFAEALGLKEQSVVIQEKAEALSKGAVEDKDQIERTKLDLSENNELILKEIEKGQEMSNEAKLKFAKGFIPYALGLVETKKIVTEAPEFIQSASDTISSASLLNKLSVTNKLATGMYIAKEMPGFASNLYDASNSLLSFAKSQDIEVPQDATSALSDVEF